MDPITRKIINANIPDVFTDTDIQKLNIPIEELTGNQDILHIADGFYCLSHEYRRHPIDVDALACKIDPTSYVSFFMALRIHNWIPEAVKLCSCTSQTKNREIDFDGIRIRYSVIRQHDHEKGTRTVDYFGTPFRIATPLKAICDIVARQNENWSSMDPLLGSLRIEEDDIKGLSSVDFHEIEGNYIGYPNVDRFLAGLRKELFL